MPVTTEKITGCLLMQGFIVFVVYLKLKEKRKSVPFTVREVSESLSVYFILQRKQKNPKTPVENVLNLTLE